MGGMYPDKRDRWRQDCFDFHDSLLPSRLLRTRTAARMRLRSVNGREEISSGRFHAAGLR